MSDPYRHQLRAHALRRRQLSTALVHGTARTWRHTRRTLPAILTGLGLSTAYIIRTTAMTTYHQRTAATPVASAATSTAVTKHHLATPSPSPSAPSPTPTAKPMPAETTPTRPPTPTVPPGAVTPTPTATTWAWDEIRSNQTGQCLDGNRIGEVYAHVCNGGNFQKWQYTASGALVNAETSLCLDSNYEAQVYTHVCNGGAFQNWTLISRGGNTYTLQNAQTGLCLDSYSTIVFTDPCNGGNFQNWVIIE